METEIATVLRPAVGHLGQDLGDALVCAEPEVVDSVCCVSMNLLDMGVSCRPIRFCASDVMWLTGLAGHGYHELYHAASRCSINYI